MTGGMKALAVTRIGRLVGKEPEILGSAKRRLRHETECLTCINAFQKRDFLGPRDDSISDPVQDGAALRPVEVAPYGKGIACRLRSRIDIGAVAARHGRNGCLINRRDALEGLSGPRRHAFAADMIQDRRGPIGGKKAFNLVTVFGKGHQGSA